MLEKQNEIDEDNDDERTAIPEALQYLNKNF